MTWTKLGDEFADDCARVNLSDAAMRTHVEGLIWTMRRETDGVIDGLDVRRFADTRHPDAAIAELVAVGFWTVLDGHWRIRHHMEHQPEADIIAKRRDVTAERVRKHRRKKAGVSTQETGNGVTDPVTQRVTSRARDGTGRDGSGNTDSPIGELQELPDWLPIRVHPGSAS